MAIPLTHYQGKSSKTARVEVPDLPLLENAEKSGLIRYFDRPEKLNVRPSHVPQHEALVFDNSEALRGWNSGNA